MFNYRFTVGTITVLGGVLALLCLVVGTVAVDFNFDAFADPQLALTYAKNAELARWFMLLDLAGYYLLLLPVIFFLHQQYKYRSPWMPLFTFSGVAYVLVGAIGATLLAATWPDLMQSYLQSDAPRQQIISLQFQTITNAVTIGLWNILEVLFAGTWWIGIGTLLYPDKKIVGLLSIATGLSALLDGIANMIGFNTLAEIGLNCYLLFAIIWPIVIGISICKQGDSEKTAS